MLHGIYARQEDRLLFLLPLLVLFYQVSAVDTVLWGVFILPEAGGIMLQACRMRVGDRDLVGAGAARLLGFVPAS